MPLTSTRAQSAGPIRIAALIALQLGAVIVVLASTPFRPFELDRFFVPKEFVFHATALVAALLCLSRVRTVSLDRVDALLLAFAALSLLSALFTHNHWLSTRALAITISGLTVFWCARMLAGANLRRPLAAALIIATVVGAATSLAQAYGVESDYFTLSRAPGGTFGNRNFVAHIAAVGTPILIWYGVTARRAFAVLLCAIGGATLAAALVLSRSRAAWLAMLVVGVLLAIPMWRAAHRVQHGNAARRLIVLGTFAVLGVVAALVIPNHLNWKSESPYLDSVRGVVDYNNGSGRGRLIQYRNTLHMVEAHPLLGVGPGNWPVYYPKFAAQADPSLAHDSGLTSNPWPSSDWVGFIAERGPVAVLLLVLAFIGIVANGFHSVRGSTANNPAARDPFLAVAVTAIVLITCAVGLFDAVMLLAAPTLIVWAALGALAAPGRARHEWTLTPGERRRLMLATAPVLTLFTFRSAAQAIAMQTFGNGESITAVRRASYWDPGDYRIAIRLADLELARRGCAAARPYAERAAGMLPSAAEPRVLLRRCGPR